MGKAEAVAKAEAKAALANHTFGAAGCCTEYPVGVPVRGYGL